MAVVYFCNIGCLCIFYLDSKHFSHRKIINRSKGDNPNLLEGFFKDFIKNRLFYEQQTYMYMIHIHKSMTTEDEELNETR